MYDNYWYEYQHRLRSGMVFKCHDGSIVQLEQRVPGDGSKWYVADFTGRSFSYENSTIEPGDLSKILTMSWSADAPI